MGQSALADRHGKCAEQCIGKRDRGTATQTLVEGSQATLDAQPAQQSPRDGASDERHHHVNPAQAENQHDRYRCDYRIHTIPL